MSFAAKAGLGVAAELSAEALRCGSWPRVRGLAEALRGMLSDVPGVAVQDRGAELCGLVSFTARGWEGRLDDLRLALRLGDRPVNVSVSRRPSTRVDFEERGLEEVVRASVHYYNSQGDLESFVRRLAEIMARG